MVFQKMPALRRPPVRLAQFVCLLGLACSGMAILGCGGSDYEKAKRHIDEGMFTQAIELLDREVAAHPASADARFLLGVAYINTGQLEAAETQFARTVQLEPSYSVQVGREYKKSGNHALKEGNTASAFNHFQRALRYQPSLKKDVANSVYIKGKELSRAGNDARAIEYHQYAIANDPLLGRDLANWYALQAVKAESELTQATLHQAAMQFEKAYRDEQARLRKANARQQAEKQALSARAKLALAIERRIDEHAWERLAHKGAKALGDKEIVQWSVKYYKAAGHQIRQLTLTSRDWVKIGRVSNRSSMFFLSTEDLWYIKSSLMTPRNLGSATKKAKGIQFRGDEFMDIAVKTETPPNDIFYWISPRS